MILSYLLTPPIYSTAWEVVKDLLPARIEL